ncbi:MAG: DUF5110 domain-containing protein, partial [Hymenobacter sp.]
TWSGLQAQVPIMLSMGQVGVGYMHSDAGGFGANATQDPELYTRWLQMAALCPVMRPHSDQVVAPEPYTYPEPYKSIVRDYAHLRATLLPYLYTLAAENTLTGAPLVRAMDYTGNHSIPAFATDASEWGTPASRQAGGWYSFLQQQELKREQTAAANAPVSSLNDQYLLGPSLLVAPISEPGQRRRNVWLPNTPGGWIDTESNETLQGGQLVGLLAPLGHIPLLARSGAFIPVTAYRPSTSVFRPDTLEMRYFPDLSRGGATSSFTSYEDDGRSAQALTNHQYATIEWQGHYSGAERAAFHLSLTARLTGTYPGAPTQRVVKLHVAGLAEAPSGVSLDSKPLPATTWRFDAARHELLLTFSLKQQTHLDIGGGAFAIFSHAQLDPETLTLTAPDSRTFTNEVAIHYLRYTVVDQPEILRIRDQRGRI